MNTQDHFNGTFFDTNPSKSLQDIYNSMTAIEDDFRNSNLYKLVADYLCGVSLLDVGSGPGHFLNYASKRGYTATGIEPDIGLINIGEKIYGNTDIEMICESVENLETNLKYDNITLIDVLEHISNDKAVLAKISNMLADDGRMVIVVPANPMLYGKRDQSIGHYRRYSKNQLLDLINSCGMRAISIRYWNAIGFLPYYIQEKIFRRSLKANFRSSNKKSRGEKLLSKLLFCWFKVIENRFNLNFGLTLICIVDMPGDYD